MRAFCRKASAVAAVLGLCLGEGRASAAAPGLSIDSLNPAPAGSAWFALDSLDLRGHWRPAFGLFLDEAYRPLVLYNPNGSTKSVIVGNQLFLHAQGSIVIANRLRLALDLPVAIYQSGNTGTLNGVTYQGPHGAALGDLRLDADVRLVGEAGKPFTLAVGTQFFLPTGSRASYTGDGGVRFAPHLEAAGQIGIFAYSASMGLLVHTQDQAYANVPVGGDLTLAAAAGVLLAHEHVLLGPELFGYTDVTDRGAAFAKTTSPIEGLLGLHGMTTSGWRFGVGGGAGFAQGLGTPSARVVASIAFAPPPRAARDRDHDGIADNEDACPEEPGTHTDDAATNGCPAPVEEVVLDAPPAPMDRDHDGIDDDIDACPEVPGEASREPSRNGCPRAVIAGSAIKIMDQVKFLTDSAELLPESDTVLMAVLKVFATHREIKRVDIVGYTDNHGPADHNEVLSEQRAASVVRWLSEHGVEPSRLENHGRGQNDPIDTNLTEGGRYNNRRVEFHIIEGTVVSGATGDAKDSPLSRRGPSGGSDADNVRAARRPRS